MHTYIFNTELGTFEITNVHPTNHHHRMYELWLEDDKIGEYATAREAAEDVAAFNTGWLEWDELESNGIHVPGFIEGWKEITAEKDEEDFAALSDLAETPIIDEMEG